MGDELHPSLAVANSFGQDVLKTMASYPQRNLRSPEQAERFMAEVFPDLERKIQLGEENIEKAHRDNEFYPPLEALFFQAKGWLYHFAMTPARSQGLADRTEVRRLGRVATEALEKAMALHESIPAIDLVPEEELHRISLEGLSATQFKDACLWSLAGVANGIGDREGEIERLRQVEALGSRHSIEATRALQELEVEMREEGKGCFIATAVYGSPARGEVRSLRLFRDRFLLPSKVGRVAVELYYRVSPPLSEWLARGRWRRGLAKAGLCPLVLLADCLLHRKIHPPEDEVSTSDGGGVRDPVAD